jgi:hypothetical protein
MSFEQVLADFGLLKATESVETLQSLYSSSFQVPSTASSSASSRSYSVLLAFLRASATGGSIPLDHSNLQQQQSSHKWNTPVLAQFMASSSSASSSQQGGPELLKLFLNTAAPAPVQWEKLSLQTLLDFVLTLKLLCPTSPPPASGGNKWVCRLLPCLTFSICNTPTSVALYIFSNALSWHELV